MKPFERVKPRKFRKTPKRTKPYAAEYKTSKHKCALCNSIMHGMPHGKRSSEVRKLSKTERRPTAIFGGVLCNKCRTLIAEESAKVKYGIKKFDDIPIKYRHYVEIMLNKVE